MNSCWDVFVAAAGGCALFPRTLGWQKTCLCSSPPQGLACRWAEAVPMSKSPDLLMVAMFACGLIQPDTTHHELTMQHCQRLSRPGCKTRDISTTDRFKYVSSLCAQGGLGQLQLYRDLCGESLHHRCQLAECCTFRGCMSAALPTTLVLFWLQA